MQLHASFSQRRPVVLFHVVLLALALVVGTAQAQTIELPQQPYLPIDLALDAASAALAQCQTDGYQVSVAVVDRGGVLKVLLRDDNTGPHTVSSSTRKAYTSASLGQPTSGLATMLAGNAEAEGLRQMDPQIIILAGGLPIVVNNVVVGGIGVGGAPVGQFDEACAQAGIDAILASGGTAAEEEATVEATEEATTEAAEEATTEEATAEATEEVAEEGAEEATAEATAEPEEEATAEPTAESEGEATDEATEEATVEPEEEATEEATPETEGETDGTATPTP